MISTATVPIGMGLMRHSAHPLAHKPQDYDPLLESIGGVPFRWFAEAFARHTYFIGTTARLGCATLDGPRVDWDKIQPLDEAACCNSHIGGYV
jgi:hypothetical protein